MKRLFLPALTGLLLLLASSDGLAQTKASPTAKKPAVRPLSKPKRAAAAPQKKESQLARLFWVYKGGQWAKYRGSSMNLGESWKEIGVTGRTYSNVLNCGKTGPEKDCLTSIGYKLFTDEPQWAMIEDTANIRDLVKQFNLSELLNSYNFELKNGIEASAFDDAFLLQTLGAPDRRTSYGGGASSFAVWEWDQHGLSITLRNGIARSYIKRD